MTAQAPDDKPDSETGHRTPDTGETPVADGEARPRARPREDSAKPDTPGTTEAEPDTGDHIDAESVEDGEVSGWRSRLAWIRDEFAPPEWWSAQPASGQQVVAYAKTAPWAPAKGPARTAGRIYAYGVAIPLTLLFIVLAWAAQRPSRAVLALVIYLIVKQTALGSFILPY